MDRIVEIKENVKNLKILTHEGYKPFKHIQRIYDKHRLVKITLENGVVLDCTENHIFPTERGQVNAFDIEITDKLKDEKLSLIKVDFFDFYEKECWVYDVVGVEGEPFFYANGILTHNCSFLGSSNTLVDPEYLDRMELKNPVRILLNSFFDVYEEPIKEASYILGVDTAKGTGRDYSVVQVLKYHTKTNVEQVAVYRNNKISPTDFAEVVIEISKYYNGAMIMIENNAEGGGVADNIWYNFEYDRIVNLDTKAIGVRSERDSKMKANLLLRDYIHNGWLKLCSERTIYELNRYEEKEGKLNIFAAAASENDDLVTGLIWAIYYFSTIFFDGIDDTGGAVIKKENQIEYYEPTILSSNSSVDFDTFENF